MGVTITENQLFLHRRIECLIKIVNDQYRGYVKNTSNI